VILGEPISGGVRTMCKRAGVLTAVELRTRKIGYTMTVNRRCKNRFVFGDILFADEWGDAHEQL